MIQHDVYIISKLGQVTTRAEHRILLYFYTHYDSLCSLIFGFFGIIMPFVDRRMAGRSISRSRRCIVTRVRAGRKTVSRSPCGRNGEDGFGPLVRPAYRLRSLEYFWLLRVIGETILMIERRRRLRVIKGIALAGTLLSVQRGRRT